MGQACSTPKKNFDSELLFHSKLMGLEDASWKIHGFQIVFPIESTVIFQLAMSASWRRVVVVSGLMSPADLSKRDAMGCSCLHRAARTGVPEAGAKEVYIFTKD